jgi:hypothetical protein
VERHLTILARMRINKSPEEVELLLIAKTLALKEWGNIALKESKAANDTAAFGVAEFEGAVAAPETRAHISLPSSSQRTTSFYLKWSKRIQIMIAGVAHVSRAGGVGLDIAESRAQGR